MKINGSNQTQWALRATYGVSRVLMMRQCDSRGNDYHGNPAPWRDIATFDSYNDAERVLLVLQADAASEDVS